jgi:ABC-2 type transport system permease protein
MLFTLVMPVIMVFVLWGGRRALMGQQMNFVFPIGAAYCLLVMTNIVYNCFGGDGGGIQFFLFAPVSFRQITAAKNLAQLTILALDVSILWLGVRLVFQAPPLRAIALTVAWLLFATPINFAIGNLLSVYSPKRIDYAVFGRQRASETTILVSLAVQMAVLGVGALALSLGRHYHTLWAGTAMLATLALFSITAYFIVLARVTRIALARRDVLTTELCRA